MRFRRCAASLAVLAVVTAACDAPPPHAPSGFLATTVDPKFVHGTDHGTDDRLAATVVTDIEDYWRGTYPQVFHTPWRPLKGGFYSVDSAHPGTPPPCAGTTSDVEGDAYYCQHADAVVWDRAALLPVLREKFGGPAVAAVLAHELGHAVQQRAGLTGTDDPPAVTEAMADCFAGGFARWTVTGKAPHLRMAHAGLDAMLSALILLRDPTAAEAGSHGDALDRFAAFAAGYRGGPTRCAAMTAGTLRLTAHYFTGSLPATAAPLSEVLRHSTTALAGYFRHAVVGRNWRPPTLDIGPGDRCGGAQGPVALCDAAGRIVVRTDEGLAELRANFGAFAVVTLLASRYAVAAAEAAGKPATGRSAVCLTGGYLAARHAALSSADLDAAVRVVLRYDYPATDAAGRHSGTGFDRLAAFHRGFTGGAAACSR